MLEIKLGLAMNERNSAERKNLKLREEVEKLKYENQQLKKQIAKKEKDELPSTTQKIQTTPKARLDKT